MLFEFHLTPHAMTVHCCLGKLKAISCATGSLAFAIIINVAAALGGGFHNRLTDPSMHSCRQDKGN